MKKIVVILMIIVPLITIQAQTPLTQENINDIPQKHLKFMGIEMGGNFDDFIKVLEKKGLKYCEVGSDDNLTVLQGEFAGTDDCMVMVDRSSDKCVTTVGVGFPLRDSWKMIYSDYFAIKNLLIKKYGNSYDSEELFEGYEPNSDNLRMAMLKSGRCKYSTMFLFVEGSISIRIMGSYDDCCVTLTYQDAISAKEKEDKAMDDL